MLLKTLYGLKQSACLWFHIFTNEFKEVGFFQSYYDHALYFDHNGIYVIVYVNNL